MTEIVVDPLLVENRFEEKGNDNDSIANTPQCFLDESVLSEVESEEEDQPLDIAQLCLKAELATVLADQVEILRAKNLVQSQAVTNIVVLYFS